MKYMELRMKLIDTGNYLEMCSIIEDSPDIEHAFLLKGEFVKETDSITLLENYELKDYVADADGSHIKFIHEFLLGSIRGFIKQNWVYVFAHSHLKHNSLDIVDFSKKDILFEQTLWELAQKEGYHLPMVSLVFHDNACKAHGFAQDGTHLDFLIEYPYQNIKYEKKDLHIFCNEEKGCIYNVFYNEAFWIDVSVAKALIQLQEKLLLGQGTLAERLILQKFAGEKISKEPPSFFEEAPDFLCQKKINRLEIILQTDCNLNCKYCYAEGGNYHHKKEKLSPKQAIIFLQQLLYNRIDEIGVIFFFGGEPSLCPETIQEVCKFINDLVEQKQLKKMPVFTMVTNGFSISDTLIQIITDYDIRLTLSMDGAKEVHDQLRVTKEGKGTFEQIQKNLLRLRQAGIEPVMIEATYTTLHQKYGLSKSMVEKQIIEITGVKNIFLADCIGDTDYAIDLSSKKKIPELEQIAVSQERETEISIDLIQHKKIVPYHCPAGFLDITLTPDGKLYPCHMFLEDESNCMAEFKDGVWNLEKYKETKEQLKHYDKIHKADCLDCWSRWLCRDCVAIEKKYSKDTFQQECKIKKKEIEKYLLKNHYFGSNMKNKKIRRN